MRASLVAISWFCGLTLGGCATAGFNAPLWPCGGGTDHCTITGADALEATDVETFLRANVSKYDEMVREVEEGKALAEVPILLAAVAGPTAIALGASTDWAIGSAAVAALGMGSSNYIQPRQRAGYVVQAREATVCVLREHVQITVEAQAAGLASYTGTERKYSATDQAAGYPAASAQIANAGIVALAASDSIVSKLKQRLANMGAAPNFGAIVTDIQTKYGQAAAGLAVDSQTQKFADAPEISEAQLKRFLEYPARIAECSAKIQ